MRPRTAAVLGVLVFAFAGAGAVALWGTGPGPGPGPGTGGGSGALVELWVSDTPRNNTVNHHGVGAAGGIVVAPATEQPGNPDLTRRSCALEALDADDGAVRWWYGIPPDACFSHALTKPAVADLDGDGDREVVAGTTTDETVVLDVADGSEQFHVPMETYSYAQPTVTDLSGNGRSEIVASDIGGGVVVARADGTVRWRGNVSGAVWDSPLVADLDGDGDREVVVGSSEETVVFGSDGAVRWRRPTSGNDVEAAQLDGDAPLELVAVGFDGIVALDGASGDREWNRSVRGSPQMVSLADGDGDGRPEAYVGLPGNVVAAIDATDGSEDWRTRLAPAENTVTPPPVLADLSADGARLVAPTSSGTVAILDPGTGAELAAYERDVPVWTAVTPAELTDDPGEEVLVRYGDGRVVALAYTG